jgi:hypothetical protein
MRLGLNFLDFKILKIKIRFKVADRGWGKGGEMTQALYAHMNNKRKKTKKVADEVHFNILPNQYFVIGNHIFC